MITCFFLFMTFCSLDMSMPTMFQGASHPRKIWKNVDMSTDLTWISQKCIKHIKRYGGFHSHGGTQKWMVYFMENLIYKIL